MPKGLRVQVPPRAEPNSVRLSVRRLIAKNRREPEISGNRRELARLQFTNFSSPTPVLCRNRARAMQVPIQAFRLHKFNRTQQLDLCAAFPFR